MRKIITYHGAIILLNILCFVQLAMLIMAREEYAADPSSFPVSPTAAAVTFVFILIIDGIYFFFLNRYGLPGRKVKDV